MLTYIQTCYSIWIFCCIPCLKGDSAAIHSNLCASLLLAHLLLLLGLDATSHPALCYAIAVTLHFLFLASFCWMLAEGWPNQGEICRSRGKLFLELKGNLTYASYQFS